MAFWPFVRIVEIAHGLLLRLSAHHASNERHSLKSNGDPPALPGWVRPRICFVREVKVHPM